MLNDALKLVNLINPDGKPFTGLVSVRSATLSDLSISERVAVFEAKSFDRIDFVFFRRFTDGRSSQILAYVVDNCDQRLDDIALAKLHQQVWLHGCAPLLYIAWLGRIDILTCVRGPDFWSDKDSDYKYDPIKTFYVQTIKTAASIDEELKKFSAQRLADGTFWEEPSNARLADSAKASYQCLIQAVVETDAILEGRNKPVLRRLLLLMVLIKYLEDRHVFPDGWFGKFCKGSGKFFDVLKNGNPEDVYKLLDFLERRFDGDVFILPRGGRKELSRNILDTFADLVEAQTINRQRYLWEQFSFEHLPVEIISHLYQRFVEGGHGTVYTPPHLASLLLDYAMPYGEITGEERILDPACGSGIFLVGAFRRLINIWRNNNNWRRPDVKTLKGILSKSIYGVELDQSAVDLTSFSLCLAVCDALQPDVILRDLKFDPLQSSNLFKDDFFQILLDTQQGGATFLAEGFDIIIGNPPFESKLSIAGNKINKIMMRLKRARGSLPDNQNAYLFLEQSLSILRPGGRVCLIQPSGLLYNLKAQPFRAHLQQKHKIDAILDFTSVRGLFAEADADPKILSVVASGSEPPKDHAINHLTFRRTMSVNERICFELDHYDYHRVPQREAETDHYVWRSNLLGGGRLLGISQRLRSMRKLFEYVKQDGWDYGEGYIVADRMKRSPAPFLEGKRFLPTTAFTDSGLDETLIDTVKDKYFRSPYTESRYSPPLILIKETDSLPIAFWNKGFLAYRAKIVGIHAPLSQISKLTKLYKTLDRNRVIYEFSCALNGIQALIGKATAITKHDIDQLPYPEDPSDLSFAFWEEALCEDVLNYMTEYIRVGQSSELLRRAANITDMQEYSKMFLRLLGSIYDNLRASDPIFFNGLICQPFHFGKYPKVSWIKERTSEELQKLVYEDKQHRRLRTLRVLRFYFDNVILIIKPDRLRYWIRSIAIRDADETLVDLRRQGY